MRLTPRGRKAVAVAGLAVAAVLYWGASSLPDACLTRAGYASCETLAP